MADDNREFEGSTTRGNEWEVVSLTTSTYDAVPGPGSAESVEEKKDKELLGDPEPSIPLFMSDHFVFPPCEHENLPLDLESSEVAELVSEKIRSALDYASFDNEQPFNADSLSGTDELPGIEHYYDKGKQIWVSAIELDRERELDGQKSIETSESHYSTNITEISTYDENDGVTELGNHSPENSQSPDETKVAKGGNYSVYPYESWWRRHVASLFAHAKEANKFWSVFIAAALMGLVILGQRWQQERWQVMQLKWDNQEKIVHRVLGPVSRFKDVVIGSRRRGLGGISTIDG